MPFTIQQIRQAPQGFKDNVLALVTFTYDADEMNPVLTAKRSAKVRDEWREYATAKIRLAPGSKVQIIDAQLMRGDRGTWLAVRDFDVPRELLAEVAAVAAERARAASDADNEDPFEQGQQARAVVVSGLSPGTFRTHHTGSLAMPHQDETGQTQQRFTAKVRRGLRDVEQILIDAFDDTKPPATTYAGTWPAARRKDFEAALAWIGQNKAPETVPEE